MNTVRNPNWRAGSIWPFNKSASKGYSDYFDYEWYVTNYAHLFETFAEADRTQASFKAALAHYRNTGWKQGFNPSPYFDVIWYLEQNPAVALLDVEPFAHYFSQGWREGLVPSVYFDPQWYLRRNVDVAEAKVEPLWHYLSSGWREGRAPSIYFDPQWYLDRNADVAAARIDPVRHYLMFGWREGRAPSIYFDPQRYVHNNPETAGSEPLRHYLLTGWRERRAPSAYFDLQWYLECNPEVLAADIEPLRHYLLIGWREGLWPNSEFNPRDYLRCNPACLSGRIEPLKHFVTRRPFEAKIGSGTVNEKKKVSPPPQARYFSLSSSPLVSIIIPNFNGAHHLRDLFASLSTQTYKNFEVIFVDDNSSDNSVALAKGFGVEGIVESKTSLCFAKANNVAMRLCSGELIALLNNDMRVDPGWLEALVTTMRKDPLIAAVAPKIRFWSKFQRLKLTSGATFELHLPGLLDSLHYKKYFVAWGHQAHEVLHSKTAEDGIRSELLIHAPVQDDPLKLSLRGKRGQVIKVIVNNSTKSIILNGDAIDFEYRYTKSDQMESYHILNNAGSGMDFDGNPYDRAFGYADDGEFDQEGEVDLFCGGSVLLRRDALHGRELFISEFGAYYEDAELGRWLRLKGYKIVFAPMSIAYHKHSATTTEKSAFWMKQTTRNKVLFDYVFADKASRPGLLEKNRLHLNHVYHWALSDRRANDRDRQFAHLIPEILQGVEQIARLIDDGATPQRSGLRIGVYNSYWNTLGGGEAHALDVAAALSRFGQVELISEENFDINHLLEYFGHRKFNVRKRLVSCFSSDITRDYDIFVNSTFQSKVVSLAKRSYCLLFFPSREAPNQFLLSYHFIAISSFTLNKMTEFWGAGSFKATVLYPIVPDSFWVDAAKPPQKQKVILSVGRFVSEGHTKNQLEIVEGFRKFVERYPQIAGAWTLMLIGTVNDAEYLAEVERASEGLKVKIIPDATFDELRAAYHKAGIYVHASGYGRDPEIEPELCEHFGIAVTQALSSGCIPIVFDAAGPKEIVEKAKAGRTWRTIDDLAERLGEVALTLEGAGGKSTIAEAVDGAHHFSRSRMDSMVQRLVMYGR